MKRKNQRNRHVDAEQRRHAREAGVSVAEIQALEDCLRAMPMERFLDEVFGPGRWFHDPAANLWIGPDRKHRGPGFGFMAIREDKSFFSGVVPERVFQ